MKEKDWLLFKKKSEDLFQTYNLDRENTYGFQIQRGTIWNDGLSVNEIVELENNFNFKLPIDYFEMLKAFNGFKTPHISIDPEGECSDEFERRCYQYHADLNNTKWLIDEVNLNINYAKECLDQNGFDSSQIEGFIPLYGHRALVVLKDKTKSPVISICGNDIIIYGKSLIDYFYHEFGLE